MSRYWVFQNNQVVGPHDAEELAQLPGYGPDTLVCSEGRKGTNMGDWQRASMMPELSVSLMKASQLAAAGKPATGAVYASLPPEPTLKDLAALGSLQEKVSFLDSTVTQLQDSLRLKENELLSLHRELEEKTNQAQGLTQKLGALEQQLASVGQLQQTLDKAVAAEHDVESTVEKQARVIEDLTREIQTLKGEQQEIEKLKGELETLRKGPILAAPAGLAAPQALPDTLEIVPPAAPPSSPAPISLEPPSPAASPAPFAGLSMPFDAPAEPAPFKPLPLDPVSPAAEPSVGPSASAPGLELGGAGAGLGLSAAPFGASAASFNPVPEAPAGADLAAKPKKSRGKALALAGLVLAGGAAAAAVKLGLLPIPALKAAKPAPPPLPAAPLAPKPPSPEEQAEAAKQAAIDMVRRFPTPKGKTIGEALEAGLKLDGGLSPWLADKIVEGVYQVNFYSSKPAGGNGQTYEFEASMADGRVTGHNPVAKALLATRPQVAATRRRRVRGKAAHGSMPGGMLSAPGYAGGPIQRAAPKKHVARRVAKPEATLDDLLSDKQDKKNEGLDQMLLPGMEKGQAGADTPQAQPTKASAAAKPASSPQGQDQGSDADLLDTMLKP